MSYLNLSGNNSFREVRKGWVGNQSRLREASIPDLDELRMAAENFHILSLRGQAPKSSARAVADTASRNKLHVYKMQPQ